MSLGYDHNLSGAAVRALFGASPARRRSAWVVIELLAKDPFLAPDLKEPSSSGRVYFVIVRENVVVTYWVDHAVKELRVLQLEFV